MEPDRNELECQTMDFDDRVAVVTGSARGIGKAIARRLFNGGATVVVADLDQACVDEACREIGPGETDRLAGFACDVSDAESVTAMFKAVKERFGRLDILVNNAGITRDSLFSRMSFEQWKQVIDVNLTGTFLCCRHAFPMLRKSPCGRIINISSLAAGGNIGQANYSASKAGVIGLTRTLSIELARYNVTANAVAPGFIDTEMTRAVPEKARQVWIEKIPLGRAGTPEDVAEAVEFLASDGAAYITGEVMEVDGGMSMPEAVAASFRKSSGGVGSTSQG
jgi:3-oxoacyl-(acyl-carrier-protein) reductase